MNMQATETSRQRRRILAVSVRTPKPKLSRRRALALVSAAVGAKLYPAFSATSVQIEPQPYFAALHRVIDVLSKLGGSLAASDTARLEQLAQESTAAAVDVAESILDHHTLIRVSVDSNSMLRISAGDAQRVLVEQGWRMFLVRVSNPAGHKRTMTIPLADRTAVGNMSPPYQLEQVPWLMDTLNKAPLIEKMWLLAQLYTEPPLTEVLSGIPVEYAVVQIFSRDHGRRIGQLSLVVAPSANERDSSSYGEITLDFDCLPSRDVGLRVLDADGRGCVASLTIKDALGRVCPPQVMRLAPDLRFQSQIYRADGETVRLPDGLYTVESRRGPEYLTGIQKVTIQHPDDRIGVRLERWIDPARWGWYSGDIHIHAAGCFHYAVPTEGVSPETMIRHARGEALSIGEVLTWAPGWYYQKKFFTGRAESPAAVLENPELQAANNATLRPRATPEDSESLIRYDMEVSGFPSSLCGHLILLRLKTQDYSGAERVEDWPSWNMPILKWAKAQGATVGYAHSHFGMLTSSTELPNYEIPPFDSIGANEAIVDVTHGLVDFLAGCDGTAVAELNAWYHLLSCGFRLAMAGETDYPCFCPPSDSRPGLGRTYVRMGQRPMDNVGYDTWVHNFQTGEMYSGDGRTHFLEFAVNGKRSGMELSLRHAASVEINAVVAARLDLEPTLDTLARSREVPWHIEHARIGKSRKVPLELVVNGVSLQSTEFVADGKPRAVRFKIALHQSSWIALRVLSSGHTYPVFVGIAGKPIRASRRSAQWCRRSVDKLWEVKSPLIRESEKTAAAKAFEYARRVYDAIVAECKTE